MLNDAFTKGIDHAAARFGLTKEAARILASGRPGAVVPPKPAPVSPAVAAAGHSAAEAATGVGGRLRSFGEGQLDAARTFGGGMRDFLGGFGGTPGTAPGRSMQRSQALGQMGQGLKGLAPSLALGGGEQQR